MVFKEIEEIPQAWRNRITSFGTVDSAILNTLLATQDCG